MPHISNLSFDYALVGGSFDPFHNGHLHLAQQILSVTDIQRIAFIPCANHNFKHDSIVLDFDTRLALIQKAIAPYPMMDAWDIDGENRSGYTSELLQEFSRLKPETSYCFVIGSDNVPSLHKWHNFSWLRLNTTFLIVPRPSYSLDVDDLKQLTYFILDAIPSPISSSHIRNRVLKGMDIQELVPPQILKEVRSLYSPL